MKKVLGVCTSLLAALFLCSVVHADSDLIIHDNYLNVSPVIAYSSTASVRTNHIGWASAQVVVTSVSAPVSSFTDGSAATATFTVASFAQLSTATATGKITIASNTAVSGQCISGGGPGTGSFNICSPANFAVDLVYSSNTACNIASAIQATGVILSTCGVAGGAVIYDSATSVGSFWNNFTEAVSSAGALTVSNLISSSPATNIGVGGFRGGQDNQSFTINGTIFLANTNFFPVTNNATTATNIATAITNSSTTTGVIASAGAGAVVYATATSVGTSTNYAIASSSQSALTIAPFTSSGTFGAVGAMSNGTNAAFTINTATLNVNGQSYGTGQKVLYTTAGSALTPLTTGTTYYIIDLSPTGPPIELATSLANAIAGTPITFTSSQTNTTADTYTLSPLGISGTPSIQWVVSNNGADWLPYTTTTFGQSIPSVSYGTYYSTGSVSNFDLGHVNYSWLGLNVTAPTAGAITINAHVIGKP